MGYVPRGRLDAVHIGGFPAPSDVESLGSVPQGTALASLFLAMAEKKTAASLGCRDIVIPFTEEHLAGS